MVFLCCNSVLLLKVYSFFLNKWVEAEQLRNIQVGTFDTMGNTNTHISCAVLFLNVCLCTTVKSSRGTAKREDTLMHIITVILPVALQKMLLVNVSIDLTGGASTYS